MNTFELSVGEAAFASKLPRLRMIYVDISIFNGIRYKIHKFFRRKIGNFSPLQQSRMNEPMLTKIADIFFLLNFTLTFFYLILL